jgi:hypothetical protein
VEVKGWADPSGRQASSGANKVVADTLKASQGKWAIVEEHVIPADADEAKGVRAKASNRASLIKQGRLRPFSPKGTFDAVSRSEVEAEGSDTQVVRVYAMYKGEEYAVTDEAPATAGV